MLSSEAAGGITFFFKNTVIFVCIAFSPRKFHDAEEIHLVPSVLSLQLFRCLGPLLQNVQEMYSVEINLLIIFSGELPFWLVLLFFFCFSSFFFRYPFFQFD